MNKKKLVDVFLILGIVFIVIGIGINLKTQEKPKVEIIKNTQAAKPTSNGLVNINTADLAQLDTLPGIGPVTAKKIVDYRLLNGSFKKIEDIQKVSGIGPKKYADIVAKISI